MSRDGAARFDAFPLGLTDASLTPDVGFAQSPFYASIDLAVHGGALLSWRDGDARTTDHTGFAASASGAARTLRFDAATATRIGLDRLTRERSTLTIERAGRSLSAPVTCEEDLRFASPRDYLLNLLPREAP